MGPSRKLNLFFIKTKHGKLFHTTGLIENIEKKKNDGYCTCKLDNDHIMDLKDKPENSYYVKTYFTYLLNPGFEYSERVKIDTQIRLRERI